MTIAAGALFILARALLIAPCWSLPALAALTAWPIWEFQRESALFHRRTVLAGVTLEGGWTRRTFWPGRLSAVWQVFVALFWASALLALGALLTWPQWLILAADAFILAVIIAPANRLLKGEVRREFLSFAARRWPLFWVNMTALTVAFLVLDFILVGAPDTRGLAWNTVAENAFAKASASATCQFAGWAIGGLAALDQLSWHAHQILIPSLPRQELKLAAWAVFLLQAGVVALAFTRFLLGIVALMDSRDRRVAAQPGAGTSPKTFYLTILVLAVPWLYATYQLRSFDPSTLATGARKVVAWANPCSPDARAIATLRSALAAELDGARVAAKQDADQRIDKELDALFSHVEQGVDRYLDWYFSVIGEYERLGAMVAGGFPALMTGKLEQQLFGSVRFDERLQQISGSIGSETERQMADLSARLGTQIQTSVRASPCKLETLNLSALGSLERDRQRFALAAGGGAAAGAVVMLLARKASTGVVGKFASKKVFQVAATMGGKVAARRAGSIVLSAAGAAAICGPGGPLAAICGLGAGVVTWLALDQAMVKIDELRFRDEMRAEMLDAARAQKAELANDLRALHHAAIDDMVRGVHDSADRAFIPARDGL